MHRILLLLSVSLVGLFAVVGSWIRPAIISAAPLQLSFTGLQSHPITTTAIDNIGIVYLSANNIWTLNDICAQMQDIIDQDLEFKCDRTKCLLALRESMCTQPSNLDMIYYYCIADVLTQSVIELIPAKQVPRVLVCSAPTFFMGFYQSLTVGSTHSTKVGFSVETGAKPFEAGLALISSFLGYGYSAFNQEAIEPNHELELKHRERGFVALVNAQASTKVRIRVCKCQMGIEYST